MQFQNPFIFLKVFWKSDDYLKVFWNDPKFAYVFNQIAIPIDKEDIYKVYKHLNKRSCILTTFTEDDITVSVLNEDGQLRTLTDNHRDDSDSE